MSDPPVIELFEDVAVVRVGGTLNPDEAIQAVVDPAVRRPARPRIPWRIGAAVVLVCGTTSATQACQVQWRDSDELRREAQLVVTAVVASTAHVGSSFRGDDFEYQVRVESVERGTLEIAELRVTYEDTKMHRRGDTVVCPLKNGSGIEHELRANARYRLFLRSAAHPELLLAETAAPG